MKGTIIYTLVLIAAGLLLTATAKYLPAPFVGIAAVSIVLLSVIRSFYMMRKRAAVGGAWQLSGLGRVSFLIICASALGVLTALILMILHIRHFGHILINYSLASCLLGILLAIFSPAKSNIATSSPTQDPRSTLFGRIIYSCCFFMISGMLLKVNHYPAGKLLMYGGIYATLAFLVFLIIYGTYAKKRIAK